MRKYKIEIEIDLDFESIFSEIPEGLFDSKDSGPDDYYYKTMILDTLADSHLYCLDRNINDLVKDKEDGMYKYLKHHNLCQLQVSKQLAKKAKVTLIEKK